MDFKSYAMSEEWRAVGIVTLFKCIGERTECMNYRDISSTWKNLCRGSNLQSN